MMEAHSNGLALVISCALEHAEFYSESLNNYGLTSTIEPDD
jgi:ATP-dependent Clp protease adaptor protein ClpS